MNPISGFIVICLIITLGYFAGLINFLADYESVKCHVTYMFEYPQFVRISNEMDKIYPKYELYAYSEGRLTERARNMYFDGVPVLFIPGNAGSFKQVRSLSSIALRKSFSSRTSYHLDYFTVNLNKEYSALNGALLYDQMDYVNSSVYRILELYADRKTPPTSVVLVGHSMGGVIARSLMSLQPAKSNLFPIVITLAAPLKRPPVLLDPHMSSFYENILVNTTSSTFVSISGGFSDLLIQPTLSDLRDNNSLHVVTSNIPLSWLQANHVQILWCKQTVLVLNRALFDSVNQKTGQISTDSKYRRDVFKHHLVHHSGTRVQKRSSYFEPVKFEHTKGEWIESLSRQYSVVLRMGLRTPHWYMVKLTNQPRYESVTVVAVNLELVNWAFVCGAHFPSGPGRVCIEGKHLTHLSEISPSMQYKRRTLRVNMHELLRNDSQMTHVVFRAMPTSEPMMFHVDIHGVGERTITVDLPRWWSMKRHVILEETTEKAVHYDLVLPQLHHVIQSYKLFLQPYDCKAEQYHATASLIVPWSNENYHLFVTHRERKPLFVRLYNTKPQFPNVGSAFVRLTLDPVCRYTVSIETSFIGMLGQMARNYTTLLLANIAAIVLMSLRAQLRNIAKNGDCSIFFTALVEGAKPYYVITSAKLITRLFSAPTVAKFLPAPDWLLLMEDGSDFFFLPLLLYTCSVGIVWLLAVGYCVSLVMLESTVNKVSLKFLAKSVSFTLSWSDHIMSMFHKLPFLVAGALITLSLTTCGGLALCLGMMFYFLKLTQMSRDFIEQVVWFLVKNFARKYKWVMFWRRKKSSDVVNAIGLNGLKLADASPKKEVVKASDVEVKEENCGDNEAVVANAQANETEARRIEATSDDDLEETEVEEFTAHNEIFFHSSIFFVWFLVTLLNAPAVLTWAHNFKFSKTLQPDPSFWSGLVLSLCALPLWQLKFPKSQRKWYKELGHVLMVAAVFCLVYTPITLYRLNYLLSGIVVLVVLHQLVAPPSDTDDEDDDGGAADSGDDAKQPVQARYEEVKAKWE